MTRRPARLGGLELLLAYNSEGELELNGKPMQPLIDELDLLFSKYKLELAEGIGFLAWRCGAACAENDATVATELRQKLKPAALDLAGEVLASTYQLEVQALLSHPSHSTH